MSSPTVRLTEGFGVAAVDPRGETSFDLTLTADNGVGRIVVVVAIDDVGARLSGRPALQSTACLLGDGGIFTTPGLYVALLSDASKSSSFLIIIFLPFLSFTLSTFNALWKMFVDGGLGACIFELPNVP
jgi:hypothetical protein